MSVSSKPWRNIAQAEFDPLLQTKLFQIVPGEVLHVFTLVVGNHAPLRADGGGEGRGQRAGSGPGFDHGEPGNDRQLQQDVADILRKDDLAAALGIAQDVVQGRGQQIERAAEMAVDPGAPRFPDHIVVFEQPAVGVEFRAGLKAHQTVFVVAADQLDHFTCFGSCHGCSSGRG